MSGASPWWTVLQAVREEFQQWANKEPKLRHLVIQPLTRGMRIPARMAAHMTANLNIVQKCDVWDWREELPEIAYLYGPLPEIKAFRDLAERAWRALALDGSTSLTGDGEPADDWLHLVYLTLHKHLPSYFYAFRKLHVVSGFAKRLCGREVIWPFAPEHERCADNVSEGSERYRLTSLYAGPFTASAAAVDVIQTTEDVRTILGWPIGGPPDLAEAACPGKPATNTSPEATAARAPTKVGKPNMPSDDAIAAFRLSLILPGSQGEVAAVLSRQLHKPVSQGSISRWLGQVRAWLKAGNILPELPTADRASTTRMDPADIDRGARLDHRTKRQREQPDPD
jgi:hypothetical protein